MFSEFLHASVELPVLSGSEKQVDWAASIRFDLLQSVDNQFRLARDVIARDFEAGKLTEARASEMRAMLETAWAGLIGKASAKWWIEHRNDSNKMLIAAAK